MLKKYPAYKDSGIEWIGEIPEHWKLPKVAIHTDLINGFPFNSENFNHTEGMPLVRIRDITTGNTETYYKGEYPLESVIQNDDILIGMDGDFLVRWWKGGKSLLNQRCCCLRSLATVHKRFLFYILQYPLNVINDLTYFTTVKHLSSFQVKDIRFPYPTDTTEQKAIADFLDKKTALIDSLVEKKKRQIELLKEQRQAAINQAVTKGLYPDAEMKDSGIEWLGKIPKHWEVKRLKFVLNDKLKYGANESGDVDDPSFARYIRITDFDDDGSLRDDTFRSLPDEQAQEYFLKSGDVLFARSGATVGKTFQFKNYDGKACFAGYLIKASPNQSRILSDYLYLNTKSNAYENWKNSVFIQATIQNIGADKYQNLPIAVPSIDEQSAIIEYLQTELSGIQQTISNAEKQIKLLQEYRTALISEAVTGKIDVRDYTNEEVLDAIR